MDTQVEQTGEVRDAADPAGTESQAPQAEEQAPEMVPVAALQAERKERQSLQENFKMLQDHVALLQANKTQEKPPQDGLSALSDDDVLTVGEARKSIQKLDSAHKMELAEIKVSLKHPDYEKVVTKYLPNVLKENPVLSETLKNAPDRFELAYHLAKTSDAYRSENHEKKKSSDAQRIIDNAKQSGNLSSMGGTSPTGTTSGSYKQMSDSDFMKVHRKNLGHF